MLVDVIAWGASIRGYLEVAGYVSQMWTGRPISKKSSRWFDSHVGTRTHPWDAGRAGTLLEPWIA